MKSSHVAVLLASAASMAPLQSFAQSVPTVSDQRTGAEKPTSDQTGPADLTTPASDDIVVTGYRASVARAQEVKRRAPSVVEAITAEDLGKFTDSSIADALQRVPGVNVSRNYRGQDQGDGVNIRGLGRAYVQTTVNGRELLGNPEFFGGSGRDFDFGSIPPDILAGIQVYKAPTANLVEAGLAGEVNLQTIRPLDVKTRYGRRYFASLTAAGFYDPNSQRLSPQFSGVVGGKLLGDTLGFYVAGVRSRERSQFNQLYNYNGIYTIGVRNAAGVVTTTPGVNAPSAFGYRLHQQNLKRDSVAAGLQWKPTSNFEVNADFLYNRYVIDIEQRNSEYVGSGFVGGFNGASFAPGGVEIRDNNVVYYDSTKITGGGRPYQRAGLLYETTPNTTQNYGLNLAWHDDSGFRIAADLSHGTVRYLMDWRNPYGTNALLGGSDVIYDIRNSKFPKLTFISPTASLQSDPNAYTFEQGLFIFQSLARNKRDLGQLDLEKDFGQGLTLKAGARYVRTTSNFVLLLNPKNDLGPVNTTNFYSGADLPPLYPISLPRANVPGICASNPVYCGLDNRGLGSFVGSFPTTTAGKPGDVLAFEPSNSYYLEERKASFYGQVDYVGQIGGLRVSGNAGLRAVRIETKAQGFQGVQYRLGNVNGPVDPRNPSVTTLVTDSASYWRYLPAINLTLKPSDNINVRLGFAKTISPAQYSVLAPRGTAVIVNPDATGGAGPSSFSGGNTQLKPTSADNYDVTFEYYTANGGAIIASGFYKKVSDLIQVANSQGTIPGQGSRQFDISASVNSQNGRVYGFELGTNQPFTFLPGALAGFGVQANYTYVNSRTSISGIGEVPFTGNSKHNFNGTIYYDRDGFNARLALFYRSREYQSSPTPLLSSYITDQYSLDFSLSKKLTDWVELRLNANNLTKRNVTEVTSPSNVLRNYYERPRSFLAGVRFSL